MTASALQWGVLVEVETRMGFEDQSTHTIYEEVAGTFYQVSDGWILAYDHPLGHTSEDGGRSDTWTVKIWRAPKLNESEDLPQGDAFGADKLSGGGSHEVAPGGGMENSLPLDGGGKSEGLSGGGLVNPKITLVRIGAIHCRQVLEHRHWGSLQYFHGGNSLVARCWCDHMEFALMPGGGIVQLRYLLQSAEQPLCWVETEYFIRPACKQK